MMGLFRINWGCLDLRRLVRKFALLATFNLLRYTGSRIHVQQISTARSLELIRRAKADGIQVTCEVTPHHLLFSESNIGDYNTRFKCNPPLRTKADGEALVEGLRDGTIDVITTAHVANTEFAIETDFESAPYGINGLETALPALFHHLIRNGKLGWDDLVRSFALNPRRILGLDAPTFEEGAKADIVVFDPSAKTRLSPETINTPFFGQELHGQVMA